MNRDLRWIGWIVLTLLLVSFSCQKKEEEIPPPTEPPPQETTDRSTEITETQKPDVHVDRETETLPEIDPSSINMEDVYFDFDKSDLRQDTLDKLKRHAEVLRANAELKVLIEGHCDERGTNEYNLALGERRANRVRDYFISSGISDSRLRTISYGEEKPKSMGNDEAAWAQNRRAKFRLSK